MRTRILFVLFSLLVPSAALARETPKQWTAQPFWTGSGTSAEGGSAPLPFFALQPCRVLDTRVSGPILSAGVPRNIVMATVCGIPAGAEAVSAIRSLAQQWSAANNIEVKLDIDPELGRLPEAIELSVYRIVQEGLSNVRKHARATQVRIVLSRTPTASLTMRLIDNGQGLPGKLDLASLSQRKSFGLVGIGERVSLLRGTMDISRSEGGGLDMTIEIPSPYPSITN